jgi:hypothetical protein
MHTQFWSENLKWWDQLGNVGVNRIVRLKWILNKIYSFEMHSIGSVESSVSISSTWYWTFRTYRCKDLLYQLNDNKLLKNDCALWSWLVEPLTCKTRRQVSESRMHELRTLLSLDAFGHGSNSEWHLYIFHRNCCVIIVKFSPDAPVRLTVLQSVVKLQLLSFWTQYILFWI